MYPSIEAFPPDPDTGRTIHAITVDSQTSWPAVRAGRFVINGTFGSALREIEPTERTW
jgi:hypothetical protein